MYLWTSKENTGSQNKSCPLRHCSLPSCLSPGPVVNPASPTAVQHIFSHIGGKHAFVNISFLNEKHVRKTPCEPSSVSVMRKQGHKEEASLGASQTWGFCSAEETLRKTVSLHFLQREVLWLHTELSNARGNASNSSPTFFHAPWNMRVKID